MDFVAVIQRIGTVDRKLQVQIDLTAQRVGQILRERVRHVDSESVDSAVRPEPQGVKEVLPDLFVAPVEVRLFAGEQVAVPLSVGCPIPGATSEVGSPIRRRMPTVLAGTVAEDIPISCSRTGRSCERLFEPGVAVGSVIRDDVDDDLDAHPVGIVGERVEDRQRSKARVDIAVVGDVVAAVGERGWIKRVQPNGIDTKIREIREPAAQTLEIPDAVGIGIGEAAWVHLVHNRGSPPSHVHGRIEVRHQSSTVREHH